MRLTSGEALFSRNIQFSDRLIKRYHNFAKIESRFLTMKGSFVENFRELSAHILLFPVCPVQESAQEAETLDFDTTQKRGRQVNEKNS
jgi:hypothetical protein